MTPRVMTGAYDSLPDLLAAVAAEHPGLDAFVDGAERLSFAGWHERASGLAAVLARRGVARGDVVCLMLPSSIDYAVCYAAALQLGADGGRRHPGPVAADAGDRLRVGARPGPRAGAGRRRARGVLRHPGA